MTEDKKKPFISKGEIIAVFLLAILLALLTVLFEVMKW